MRRTYLSSCVLVAVVFVQPFCCGQETTYVTFDEAGMTDGARISDEYVAVGVHFVSDYVSSGPFRSAPTIRAIGAAWSKPNVLVNEAVDPEIFTSANVPLVIRFDKAIAGVGMRLGCPGGSCINVPTATIRLYDCTGVLRASKTVTVKPDFSEGTEVFDDTKTTRTVVVDYGDTAVAEALDDLAFQAAPKQVICTGASDPVVDITSHSDGDLVATSKINLEGTVKDPAGAVVTFKINGTSAPLSPRSGTAGGPPTYTFYHSMSLISGANVITARATNLAGKFHADTVTVHYGPPSTVSITEFHVTQRGIMQNQTCDCDTPLVAGKFTIVRVKLDVRTADGSPTYVGFLEMNLYRRVSGQDVLVETFPGEIYSGQTSMNIGYNSPSQLAAIHFWVPAKTVDAAGDYTMRFQAWLGGVKVDAELQVPCGSKYLTFNETKAVKVFMVPAQVPLFDPQLGPEHAAALVTQFSEVSRTFPIREGWSYWLNSSNTGIKLAAGDPAIFCDGVSTSSKWCKGTGFEWTFRDTHPAGFWRSDHAQVTTTQPRCDLNNPNLGGRLLSALPVANLPASPIGLFRGGAHPGSGTRYSFPFDENHDNQIDWNDVVLHASEFLDSVGDAAHPATNQWSTDFQNRYNHGETIRQFRDLNGNNCFDEKTEKSTVAPILNLWYNVDGLLLPMAEEGLNKFNKQNPSHKFEYSYLAFPVRFNPFTSEFGSYGPGSSNGNLAWIRVEPDDTIAHELGHNVADLEDLYLVNHRNGVPITQPERQVPAWAAYEYTRQLTVSATSPIMELMNGGGVTFFNAANYQSVYDKLKVSSSSAATSRTAETTANQADANAFQLSATIDPSGLLGSVSAQILWTQDFSLPDERSRYRLILGHRRTVLHEHRIALAKNYPIDSGDGSELYPLDRFDVTVPLPTRETFSWYEVRFDETILLRGEKTAYTPTVRIISPNGGEQFSSNQEVRITWQAEDEDGDLLNYSVFYSPDNGQRWHVIATGLTVAEVVWRTNTAPGSNEGRIRVVASDGLNEGEDESDAVFRVEGKPPVAVILAPKPNQEFLQWQKVQLRSWALDLDGDEVEAFWRLNGVVTVRSQDGMLDPLPPGDYQLTLEVSDPAGRTSTASLNFKVLADWDKDGMSDLWEEKWGFDPSDPYDSLADADGDGVKNIDEAWQGTIPINLVMTWFYFPQIADGVMGNIRYQTTLVFVNAGVDTSLQVDFFDSDGQPMALTLGGAPASPTFSYSLKEGASLSLQTGGVGNLRVGYARVLTSTNVDGTAVFSRMDGGVLWYEAGVPKTRGLTDFSLFMDSTGPSRETGLAIVNAGDAVAQGTLRLYDKDFSLRAVKTLAQILGTEQGLGVGRHLARYAPEIFPEILESNLQEGVITVQSEQPLAAITLRQNDDPALAYPQDITSMCAFPVIGGRADAAPSGSRQTVFYFPQVADGVSRNIRFQTSLVFVNSGDETGVRVEFFRQDGAPLRLSFTADPEPQLDVLAFTLRRGQAFAAQTIGSGSMKVGYARVTTGTQVGGTAVFSCWDGEFRLFDAGVPASRALTDLTIVVDTTGGNRDTGLAVLNAGSAAANATLRLYDKTFQLVASRSINELLGGLAFESGYHLARYASEIFPQVAQGVVREGIITVESDQPLAAVTLRQHNPVRTFPWDFYLLTAFPVVPGRAQ